MKNISARELSYFLYKNKVNWNGVYGVGEDQIYLAKSLKDVLSEEDNVLFVEYNGMYVSCTLKADEETFILESKRFKINIDLSQKWSKFLKRAKEYAPEEELVGERV